MVVSSYEQGLAAFRLTREPSLERLPVRRRRPVVARDQVERVAEYCTPPTMMTLVAPVPRTAVTSSCIPAAWKLMPVHVPPSRQQRQASGVSALLSGNGSLNRSKITRLLPP